jgi:photosystem II stability/assembly factor-like uncharacterized protein
MAVGETSSHGVIIRTQNGGVIWTVEEAPNGTTALESVSCSTSRDCTAVGQLAPLSEEVLTTTNGGGTWTEIVLPSTVTDLVDISCPLASQCLAGGLNSDFGGIVVGNLTH